MKTKLFLLLMFTCTFQAFGQIKFEKGYIIDNEGTKLECLIENYDWNTNPTNISYKIGETGEVLIGDFTNIKEFQVDGASKYVRIKTKIDQSSMDMAKLSRVKNPVWEEQTQFLKVLVEGKAVLYTYVSANLIRFFYSVSNSDVQQLIYKEWLFDKGGNGDDIKLAANNSFQQQLIVDVPLPNANSGSVTTLGYTKSQLERYFKKYNAAYFIAETTPKDATVSENIEPNTTSSKPKSIFLNVKLAPGININTLVVDISSSSYTYYHTDFEPYATIRYGLETELLMPFNKNKWGIVLEGNYQKSQEESINDKKYGGATLDYTSLDIALGVRNYYFLNIDLKLYLNAFLIAPISDFDSKIYRHTASNQNALIPLDIKAPITYAVGGGCEYKRLSFECRWCGTKNLVIYETGWEAKYGCLSFILGYKILQFKK